MASKGPPVGVAWHIYCDMFIAGLSLDRSGAGRIESGQN